MYIESDFLYLAYSTRACPKRISDQGHFVQCCAQHLSLCPSNDVAGVALLAWLADDVLFCFCVVLACANHQARQLIIGASRSPKFTLLTESRQNQGHFLPFMCRALFLGSEENRNSNLVEPSCVRPQDKSLSSLINTSTPYLPNIIEIPRVSH